MSTRVKTKTKAAELRDAKQALYREAILDGAEAVFADNGYDAKVADIAAASGVSVATLYSVFSSKETLLRALQKRRLDQLMVIIGETIAGEADPFDLVRLGIDVYLRFHMAHPNYLRMHLREGTAWALSDRLRTEEQTVAWRNGLDMMVAALRAGIDAGVFIADDPELMARTAVGMHQVRLALWIDRGMVDTPDDISRYATVQLIRTFCVRARAAELLRRCGYEDEA